MTDEFSRRRPRIVPKSRPCLSCGRDFLSAGPSNRICPRCSNRNRNLARIDQLGAANSEIPCPPE